MPSSNCAPNGIPTDDAKGAHQDRDDRQRQRSAGLAEHIRNKERREKLANRFKDPKDPFKIAIVRDMWLTGFDVPPLHTMYIDKPMQGHGLMQAIARVNRVYNDKPGGLIVDYLGLAYHLQKALAAYTESGGKGNTAIDQDEAVALALREYEICRDMFHGFDYSKWKNGKGHEKLVLMNWAQDHILGLEDGKQRFLQTVTRLSQAFALAVPNEKVLAIRDDVGFFQAVRARIIKILARTRTPGGRRGAGHPPDHLAGGRFG